MLPQVLMWVGDVLTAIENTFDLLCAKPPFKSAQDHRVRVPSIMSNRMLVVLK